MRWWIPLVLVVAAACSDHPVALEMAPAPEGPVDPPPPRIDSIRITGSLMTPPIGGGGYCVYPWDFFGEFAEPCSTHPVTIPGAGYLVMALDFEPFECNPYGGLWFSMFPLAGSYETYWADCLPFDTAPCPAFVDGPGDYPVTVGLHATPDAWEPGHRADYVLTVIFTPLEPGSAAAALLTAAIRCHS